MIAEHREPKGLAPDAKAIGAFMAGANHRENAERGSALLRDAILEKHFGIIIPKARREPLRKVERCPACLGPVKPMLLIAGIQQTVAAYYGFHPNLMTGNSRIREVSHARQVAMYLATELTRHSVAEIGRRFKKDHTTVLHARKAVGRRMEADAEILLDVEVLRERLAG